MLLCIYHMKNGGKMMKYKSKPPFGILTALESKEKEGGRHEKGSL